jgi:Cu/Ag efflux protein CusF
MTIHKPLAIASSLLLALTACAAAPPASAGVPARPAVDLGPSTRVPAARITVARSGQHASAPAILPVRDGGGDAHATGTVNSVDIAQRKINLSHSPIPAIGWPAMTMDFPVAPTVDLARIKPGTRVEFTVEKGKNGMYEVQSVQPAGAGK